MGLARAFVWDSDSSGKILVQRVAKLNKVTQKRLVRRVLYLKTAMPMRLQCSCTSRCCNPATEEVIMPRASDNSYVSGLPSLG